MFDITWITCYRTEVHASDTSGQEYQKDPEKTHRNGRHKGTTSATGPFSVNTIYIRFNLCLVIFNLESSSYTLKLIFISLQEVQGKEV